MPNVKGEASSISKKVRVSASFGVTYPFSRVIERRQYKAHACSSALKEQARESPSAGNFAGVDQ